MPPKNALTLDRVQWYGLDAGDAARDRIADDGVPRFHHLSWEYKGVAVSNGIFDIAAKVTKRCTLTYE